MGKRNTGVSASVGRFRKFFFIGPDCGATIDELGDALIRMGSIEEVHVEDHILGYVARVRFSAAREQKPASYLARRLGDRFGLVRDD